MPVTYRRLIFLTGVMDEGDVNVVSGGHVIPFYQMLTTTAKAQGVDNATHAASATAWRAWIATYFSTHSKT